MKELSIEEKAKAYDEAKARMSKACNSNRCTIGFMNEIFPELKESEDERIRKEIIAFLKENFETGRAEETWSLSGLERWIAWLEKQKTTDVLDKEEREFADNVDSYRICCIIQILLLMEYSYLKDCLNMNLGKR